MTASPPGGSDVAETSPPPTKRTDVPQHWTANPTGWWSHVAQCPACSERFEAPAE